MTLDSARARFERRQADLFRDNARIEEPGVGGTLDPVTGVFTPNPPTVRYNGPCLIRGFAWEGTDVAVGGTEVRLRRFRCKFPAGTPVEKDWNVTPTASTYDASLVGRPLRVTDVPRDGWQISRWVIAEEVTE